MTGYVAEELQKTSATSSSTDLDWTRENSLASDVQSVTAASSVADLLKTTLNSSFVELLPALVQLPLVSQVPDPRDDVPIEAATDTGMHMTSFSARERRGEHDLAAKESVTTDTDFDQIADGQESRSVLPAWSLLNDALASYRTESKQGGVANRHRSNGWLRSLGSPKLPSPRPPPLKGSGTSPISAAGSPFLPARGSMEAASRPNTSGGVCARPQLRPGNQIRRPETSPSVGTHPSGNCRHSLRESADSGSELIVGTRQGSTTVTKLGKPPNAKLEPIFGLYSKAGRLAKKAFEITQHERKQVCNLAKSCRKQTVMEERLLRKEEHNIASAQTKNFESHQVEKRLVELTSRGNSFEGLTPRNQRGGTREDLTSPFFPRAGGRSSAEQAQQRKLRTRQQGNADKSALDQIDDLSTFQAFDLANAWNLPAGQVTWAWQCFKRYDTDDNGLLSIDEFQMLLRYVLRESFSSAREIPRSLFTIIEEIKSENRTVTFIDFLIWVSQNSFSEELLADGEQRFIRRLARKLEAPVVEIENVKRHFDSFDTDGSGHIEYDEFYKLLGKLLNLADMSDLPESRVKSFWREVDEDGSGVIEFHEFVPWYVGYFGGLKGETPLVNFYRKVRPNPFRDGYNEVDE